MTKNITGIDLGTTISAVAILNEMGKSEIVPNVDGERNTPLRDQFISRLKSVLESRNTLE